MTIAPPILKPTTAWTLEKLGNGWTIAVLTIVNNKVVKKTNSVQDIKDIQISKILNDLISYGE
jgi:hypothetical protein